MANCLDGRTGQQCLHRWQKTLNPTIRRGRWTKEEDKVNLTRKIIHYIIIYKIKLKS